jgi:hypothetical protein
MSKKKKDSKLKAIAKNPKVQAVAMSAATAAAVSFGGPLAGQAVQYLLPMIAGLFG